MGRSFRHQMRLSLYASSSVDLVGILLQEVVGGEVRTICVSLTLGVLLLHIYGTESSQQRA